MASFGGVSPSSEANMWSKLEEDNDSLQYRPSLLPFT
jgi:hypothetical protein